MTVSLAIPVPFLSTLESVYLNFYEINVVFVSDSGGTGNLLPEDCVGGTGSEDPEMSSSGTNEAGDDPEADKKTQRKH